MSASNYLEGRILDVLNGIPLEIEEVFVSLHTADPTDNGLAASEVSVAQYPQYVRQAVPATGAWGSKTSEQDGATSMSNAVQYNFPQNTGGSAVEVTHLGLYDAQTNGNFLVKSLELETHVIVGVNAGLAIPAGGFKVLVD